MSTPSASGNGQILRVGLLNEVHHVDPRTAQDFDSLFVSRQIFEPLYRVDPHRGNIGSAVPLLLRAPLRTVAGGAGGTMRGRIRDDARFSDGSPLDLETVVQSLGSEPMVRRQAEVTAEGDELVFHLKSPNARFDLLLTSVQGAIVRRAGGSPVGTGPYQLARDSEPGHIRLVRNPHSPQPGLVDEIHFITYSPGLDGRPESLLIALESGEVDFTNVLPRDEISGLTGVRKSFQTGVSTAVLYLNTQSPPLRSAKARQAIAHAVQRRDLTSSCYSNSLAFTAASLLPRSLGQVTDRLGYDPDRSRSLLSELGDEAPTKLRLLMTWGPRPYLPHPQKVMNLLAEQLEAVGIEITPRFTHSSREFFDAGIEGDYDLALAGWIADTPDPADFLESNLASYRIPRPDNIAVSVNLSRLEDPEMDESIARLRRDGTDQRLREAMRRVDDLAPLVPLMYGPTSAVLAFRVQGFTPSPLGVLPLAPLYLR
ncbi:MAG: ABC transporter substrate-binding protein [Acidobacteriota bacterium]